MVQNISEVYKDYDDSADDRANGFAPGTQEKITRGTSIWVENQEMSWSFLGKDVQ